MDHIRILDIIQIDQFGDSSLVLLCNLGQGIAVLNGVINLLAFLDLLVHSRLHSVVVVTGFSQLFLSGVAVR